MSLATLAAQLDTNTKYLSETINKHYHDNFNTYINRLRINYIIEKLKNEPEYLNYKISYLAEESGFSSHSSFATIFKTITGIAPTVFIELIGKEITQKKA
jgi:YesN/AraC family two-component response regulator